ncbi:MAG: DUF47 family protein [Sphingomonadaceae bacterium]|nr:DUF47 family protein [Sphingomonadaceae bacterium]
MPYRTEADGALSVLLITSRETRRWVLPKGNVIRGLAAHEAAAHEAFEEAGVIGVPCPTPIGFYRYAKRRKNGVLRTMTVDVFPFAVTDQAEDWPEQDERELRWFAPQEAAGAVEESELKALLANFRAPAPAPGLARRVVPAVRSSAANRLPFLRWFQALLPSEGRFFELFEAHAATLVAGADALARLFHDDGVIEPHVREIMVREQEADDVTRAVLQDVRRIFVTPFDRSAITSLIGVMDDAIDQMNATAKAVTLFGVHEFEPAMRDLSGIIVEAARVTAEAIPLLRSVNANAGELNRLTERIIEIEGDADEISDFGIKMLFEKSQDQPMRFIVGKDLYEHLEAIVDRFEDLANEIQGLVIDHA